MRKYFGNVSRYTAAFYTGLVAFEVLINVLLLVFTEGAGNVVKGTTYLQKMVSLLKVVARETVSVVTGGITDLLAFLGKFVAQFAKACENGWRAFLRWIEELLGKTKNNNSIENLLEETKDIDEIIFEIRQEKCK